MFMEHPVRASRRTRDSRWNRAVGRYRTDTGGGMPPGFPPSLWFLHGRGLWQR